MTAKAKKNKHLQIFNLAAGLCFRGGPSKQQALQEACPVL